MSLSLSFLLLIKDDLHAPDLDMIVVPQNAFYDSHTVDICPVGAVKILDVIFLVAMKDAGMSSRDIAGRELKLAFGAPTDVKSFFRQSSFISRLAKDGRLLRQRQTCCLIKMIRVVMGDNNAIYPIYDLCCLEWQLNYWISGNTGKGIKFTFGRQHWIGENRATRIGYFHCGISNKLNYHIFIP